MKSVLAARVPDILVSAVGRRHWDMPCPNCLGPTIAPEDGAMLGSIWLVEGVDQGVTEITPTVIWTSVGEVNETIHRERKPQA